MPSPYYPLKPIRAARSVQSDFERKEPNVAVTEIKRIALKASPETIVKAERWLQLTLQTASASVRIGTKSGDVAQNTAFSIPADVIVTIVVCPGTMIYTSGPDGSYINVIVQPLPVKSS